MIILLKDILGEEIINFDCECNPYKIGEKIEVDVYNKDEDVWGVEELHQEYEILDIKHSTEITYSANGIHAYTHIYVTLIVKELIKEE